MTFAEFVGLTLIFVMFAAITTALGYAIRFLERLSRENVNREDG